MSKNAEASEAMKHKYCSAKIFHLREHVNFNFSFFQALASCPKIWYICVIHAATPIREHSDFKLIMHQIMAHI